MIVTSASSLTSRSTVRPIIDCDLHNVVPNTETLFPYLPSYWVEHIQKTLFKGPVDTYYPKNAPITAQSESRPANGDPAGSSLELLQMQALDGAGVDVGILNCLYPIDSLRNPDAAMALATAVNDWQIAEWLDKEPRLRASIVVPSQNPLAAAREIDRVGPHPGFVQVCLPVRSEQPYGNRVYQPMWEAITRHDLVAGIHFGGAPGSPPTPSGWSSYFFEDYVGMAHVFASQVTSIITEGVFDLHPTARVTLLEAGFTWLPAHMWRFDKEWRNLRRLVPWVKRAPSEYIREHIRLTIQPLDAPPTPQFMLDIVDQIGSDDVLLYASDYPHQHAFDAEEKLLRLLPEATARKILNENARTLYKL
jgi:uncharacterized protein